MSFLERHPALKKAVANQYQAILAAGVIGFSAITLSPLPLLLWAGVQMMTLPFLVERLKRRLNEIYVKHTGQDYETVHQALERDNFMTVEQAKDFGLIDSIFHKRAAPETV